MQFWSGTPFLPTREALQIAQLLDEAGFDGVICADHMIYPKDLRSRYPSESGKPGWAPETAWPDSWVMIGAMAALTTNLRFSNAVYVAINEAQADVRAGRIGQVPAHLRDAHYSGAKDLGHGKGYLYSHDEPFGVAQQQYHPDVLADAAYYRPKTLGHESQVKDRWERVRRLIRGR